MYTYGYTTVSLLFFYMDGFGIKQHPKFDMPLQKEKTITLVYKNKFLVWGKNGDMCFLLIWVCWTQIYK